MLVPGLTDDMDDLARTAEFAAALGNVERVEVLPFHQMGKFKWERLGLSYSLTDVQPPTAEATERACEVLRRAGLKAHEYPRVPTRTDMAAPPFGESYDELIRRLAVILGVATIAAVSVWIVAPFLPAILWAGTIAVATWPVLLRLQAMLGGRRWAATTVLSLILAVGFFIPLLMVVGTIVQHAGDAADLARDISANGLPAAPAWLESIPVVGKRAAAEWTAVAALDAAAVRERLEPALRVATRWLVGSAGDSCSWFSR